MSGQELLQFHQWLLADEARTCAYRQAIPAVVSRGDVVADIGAGSGILSFFACVAGARKVYAIEPTDAIDMARELCACNGFSGIVEFLKDFSQNIMLPEPVDVVVSDTGGSFGLGGGMLGILQDAKQRFLRPSSRIIPRALFLFVAPLELDSGDQLQMWQKDRYGLDLSPIRRFAANNTFGMRVKPGGLLGAPKELVKISFEEFDGLYVAGQATCIAERDGLMHGLAGWMKTELAPGVSFTNSPMETGVDWGQAFFPVDPPVPLRTGDRVRAHFQTHDGQVWRWKILVTDESGRSKASFDHCTWWGFPVTADQLRRVRANFGPRLSRKGQAESYLLGALNGDRTADELAEELQRRFAECFATRAAAAQFVQKVIERCA